MIEKSSQATVKNYALPPIKLNYGDYMTPFELFYREIRKLPIEDHELEKLKTEIKKEAYSSFDNYNFWNELNINKEEYLALKGLSSNKNIILQKADKGNSVVLVNKADYIKRMKELLSDVSKFKEITVEPGKEINLLLQHEGKLIEFLQQIKSSVTTDLYKHLYPQGSQPGIMYGLSKIHKPLVNGFPRLRPILSAINTGTYKWAKFLVPLLKPFTSNNYTVKDSFDFAKDITQQSSKLFMASLDVDSLFTNVPLDETIEICVNELFKSSQTVSGLNKQQVLEMLSLTTKENVILFDGKYYSQIDGVAMGSPLGPTFANIFLCHHETTWLKNCPKAFKPVYYKRYVDDIFVLFEKPEQVSRFVNYMNKRHKNIKFSFETEKDNSFSFLDVKICREKDKFTTDVFRKDTFSGIYTNFSSFVALEHKFGLVYTLLHRSFTIVSDFSKFRFEVKTLKKTLHKNAYPTNFVDKCISKFINSIFVQKPVVTSVPKLELRIILPFLGNISSITKKRLNRCIGKRLKFCNLKIIFQTGNRLMNYFRFKDCIPETLQSNFVYKFKCGSCTASYYGKTYRHMKVRISEHQGVSPRTGKRVKGTLSTSVRDHMLNCNHTVAWEDFSIIGRESNHYLLETKESLFIKRDKPSLNRNKYSQELFLF